MAILFNFSPTLSHLHPLQVENCDSNSRLVVDDVDNGEVRLERVNHVNPFTAENDYGHVSLFYYQVKSQ